MSEDTVRRIQDEIYNAFDKIEDCQQQYLGYSNAQSKDKMRIVKVIEDQINKTEKNLKTLDFEVNMLAGGIREGYRMDFQMLRQKYE